MIGNNTLGQSSGLFIMKYITYNDILVENLRTIGFKRKNKNSFVKILGDARQELFFSHSTHNQSFVKFYTIGIILEYPQIEELAKEIGVPTYGIGVDIGYLMPEKAYHEWEVRDSDSIESIEDVVENMSLNILNYAIPYMDEYSRHEGLLKGLEEKRLQNRTDPRYCLPLLYCLMENKKRALEICEYYLKQNPNSRAYTLFCDKFKQYVLTIM